MNLLMITTKYSIHFGLNGEIDVDTDDLEDVIKLLL